jgi:hypothetical protein
MIKPINSELCCTLEHGLYYAWSLYDLVVGVVIIVHCIILKYVEIMISCCVILKYVEIMILYSMNLEQQ